MPLAQAPILPQIVGIINVTPDSFSDGGKFLDPDKAIKRCMELVEEGADIIDIGAESSSPGTNQISVEEEWRRLEPVLKVVARELRISVDTYKAEVARRALDLGVVMINDISALRADRDIASVVSKARCKVIIMHSKEKDESPKVSQFPKSYRDIIGEISEFLSQRIQFAVSKGIQSENIIPDPGLGLFLSSEVNDSWEVIRRIEELHALELPLFIGASRKSFLRHTGETSPSDRDPVSALIGVYLAQKGVGYIRTHNVKLMKEFLVTWSKLDVRA